MNIDNQYIQTITLTHDPSITHVYYESLNQFNRHHHTINRVVFNDNKEVTTIYHILKDDKTLLLYSSRPVP